METRTVIIYTQTRDQSSENTLLLALALALVALGLLVDAAISPVAGLVALGPVAVALGMTLTIFVQEARQ